jgi:hypothetical protein
MRTKMGILFSFHGWSGGFEANCLQKLLQAESDAGVETIEL